MGECPIKRLCSPLCNIVLSSMISKAIVMIELTVPGKTDVTKPTRERKQNTSNYKKIAKDGSAGWF